MDAPAGRARRCSALGGWVAIGAMLSISCGYPTPFLAQVDNKTGLPREVRVVSESGDRRAELVADVAPEGSVVLDAEGSAWAEVEGVRRFQLDRCNPAV